MASHVHMAQHCGFTLECNTILTQEVQALYRARELFAQPVDLENRSIQ